MNKIIILATLLTATLRASAQSMKELLAQMPDSIIPTLTRNDRLDMIDFVENNMQKSVTNRLKAESQMQTLTEQSALITLSTLARLQIFWFQTEALSGANSPQTIVGIIHSCKADAWDSTIRFYDSQWQRIPTSQLLDMPVTQDFITRKADQTDTEYANIINCASYPFLEARFLAETSTPSQPTIAFTYNSSNAADENFQRLVQPQVIPTQTYHWNPQTHKFLPTK